MHFRWKYALSHYMVLTNIQVFFIWNDFIRLHTFQNGKRSQNVDRPKPTIIITDIVIIVNFYVQVNFSNFEQLTVDFKLLLEVCRLRLAVCRKCQF